MRRYDRCNEMTLAGPGFGYKLVYSTVANLETLVKSIALALTGVFVAACHGQLPQGPSPYRTSYGDFQFAERLRPTQPPLEGTISVVGDEIEVDTKDIGCFTMASKDPKAQTFKCGTYYIRATKVREEWQFSYGSQTRIFGPIRLNPVAMAGITPLEVQ